MARPTAALASNADVLVETCDDADRARTAYPANSQTITASVMARNLSDVRMAVSSSFLP
jgi:hypothetical protein